MQNLIQFLAQVIDDNTCTPTSVLEDLIAALTMLSTICILSSFVKESGFQSSGNNLSSVALRHQASKMHITNHIASNVLGNVDVACALDEARQRGITEHNHNVTRYGRMLEHHINTTVF